MHTEGIVDALKPFLTGAQSKQLILEENYSVKFAFIQDHDCVVDLHEIESALRDAELLSVQKDILLMYARWLQHCRPR